jgi:hypothetical protein
LLASKLEDRPLLIGEHDRARASPDRQTRAGCAIHASDIRRSIDVPDRATQFGFRAAENKTVV